MYYLTELDPRGAMGLGGKDEVGVSGIGSYIAAIDYKTGKTMWRHKFATSTPTGRGSPGLLTTAGRLLFGGDVSGNFVAFDAVKGTPLWHARIGQVSNAPQRIWSMDASMCSSPLAIPFTRLRCTERPT
jgi:alcohol dehydrogenase (cytochrome c)